MRKLCVVLIVATHMMLYAGGTVESQTSFGMQYANVYESQLVSTIDVATTLHSIGAFSRNNTFFNNNEKQGVFTIGSFLIPLGGTITISGESLNYSFDQADFRALLGLAVGPVYRIKLNKETSMLIGIGPSVQEIAMTSPSDAALVILVGACADICVQNRISDSSFLTLGVSFEYDFTSWTKTIAIEGWSSPGYASISIRPYLGIGFSRKTITTRVE